MNLKLEYLIHEVTLVCRHFSLTEPFAMLNNTLVRLRKELLNLFEIICGFPNIIGDVNRIYYVEMVVFYILAILYRHFTCVKYLANLLLSRVELIAVEVEKGNTKFA
jgi:hypothetical protein